MASLTWLQRVLAGSSAGAQPGASVITHVDLSMKLLELHPYGGQVSRKSVPSRKDRNFRSLKVQAQITQKVPFLPHSIGQNKSWGHARFKGREISL